MKLNTKKIIVAEHSVGDLLFSREELNLGDNFFFVLIGKVQYPDLSNEHLALISRSINDGFVSEYDLENLDVLGDQVLYQIISVRDQGNRYWIPQNLLNKLFRKNNSDNKEVIISE